MINLLPLKEKQALYEEKCFREVLILSFAIFSAVCSLTLILVLIEIDLENKVLSQGILLQQRKEEFELSEVNQLQKEIDSINSFILRANSFYQSKTYLSDFINEISEIMPSGIMVTNLSYKKESQKVSISGIASERQDLLLFKQAIEKNERFSDLYFPNSNWLQPYDVNFLINFVVR